MMNVVITSILVASEGGAPTYESHHWLLPETFEIIYGGISSVLVISALIKFAGPVVKKSLAARTERIQNEIDNARNARTNAEAEAQQIRSALGDISSERARIMAEVADVEAKALADIANASGRVQDELAADIKRLARVASDKVIASAVNDSVRQDLIENFISGVAR